MTPTGFATCLAVVSSVRNQEPAKHADEHQNNEHERGDQKEDTLAHRVQGWIDDMGCHQEQQDQEWCDPDEKDRCAHKEKHPSALLDGCQRLLVQSCHLRQPEYQYRLVGAGSRILRSECVPGQRCLRVAATKQPIRKEQKPRHRQNNVNRVLPCAPSRRLLDSYRRCTNPKRPKCPLDSFSLFLRFSRWPWQVATKCRSMSSASSKALRCHPILQRLWDRRLGLRFRTGSGHRGRTAWERYLPSSTPPRQRKTSKAVGFRTSATRSALTACSAQIGRASC